MAKPTSELNSALGYGIFLQALAGFMYGIASNEGLDPVAYIALVVIIIGGLLTFIGAVGWAVYLGMQAHAKSGN